MESCRYAKYLTHNKCLKYLADLKKINITAEANIMPPKSAFLRPNISVCLLTAIGFKYSHLGCSFLDKSQFANLLRTCGILK